jgi:hypothetical protein
MEEAEVTGERFAMEKDPPVPKPMPKVEKPGPVEEVVKEL